MIPRSRGAQYDGAVGGGGSNSSPAAGHQLAQREGHVLLRSCSIEKHRSGRHHMSGNRRFETIKPLSDPRAAFVRGAVPLSRVNPPFSLTFLNRRTAVLSYLHEKMTPIG